MKKLSESEKKVLLAWLIVGIAIMLILLVVKVKKNNSVTNSIVSPNSNHVINRNRYYTVKNAIDKYYQYKNAKDYDAVLKILNEKYIDKNHIDKDTITNYIGEVKSYLTFDTGLMCLKSSSSGVDTYVVEGTDIVMNTGEEKNKAYYEVTLDGNTFLFNITPIDEKTFGGVCDE